MEIENGMITQLSCAEIIQSPISLAKTEKLIFYPMSNPEGICVHNFGTNHLAKDVTKWIDEYIEYVQWHLTIGEGVVYQEMSLLKNGWHAGDGVNGKGNRRYIAIEVQETEAATATAISVIAEMILCKDISFELEKVSDIVKPHQFFSKNKKYCPRKILSIWDYFIEEIENKIASPFIDISGHYAEKEIIQANKQGLMNGFNDGTFRPDKQLTRAEMAIILSRLQKEDK